MGNRGGQGRFVRRWWKSSSSGGASWEISSSPSAPHVRDVMARRMVARVVSRQPSITSDHVDARKENIKRALRAQRSPRHDVALAPTMLPRVQSPLSLLRCTGNLIRERSTRASEKFFPSSFYSYGSSAGSRIRTQRGKYLEVEIYIFDPLAFVHFLFHYCD